MAIRVRLNMTWRTQSNWDGLPFSKPEDFVAHATAALTLPFSHSYKPEVSVEMVDLIEGCSPSMQIFSLVWDIDLDETEGMLHEPSDHVRHATYHLVDGMAAFGRKLIVEVLRHAEPCDIDGATDFAPWEKAYRDRRYAVLNARADAA